MKIALPLAVLLAAASARAERRWSVEPGQTLVSMDAAQFSAFSYGLNGELEEQDDGAVRLLLRIPLATLTTGDSALDRSVPREGELVLDLSGRPSGDESIDFEGTITVHEVAKPVKFRLSVARSEAVIFGHAVVTVHLRDFGIAVPAAARDSARIEVDTALRRQRAVASRE